MTTLAQFSVVLFEENKQTHGFILLVYSTMSPIATAFYTSINAFALLQAPLQVLANKKIVCSLESDHR